jgi:hypothetical protein
MADLTSVEPTDTAHPDAVFEDGLFRAFFGQNSGKFEKTLHQMRGQNKELAAIIPTWCWPAFIITVPWFFYRKMYAWGVGVVALLTVLELMIGESIAGRAAVFALMAINAKSLYIHHASRRLKHLRAAHTDEAELLRRATVQGGVSPLSAAIGTVLVIGALLLTEILFE